MKQFDVEFIFLAGNNRLTSSSVNKERRTDGRILHNTKNCEIILHKILAHKQQLMSLVSMEIHKKAFRKQKYSKTICVKQMQKLRESLNLEGQNKAFLSRFLFLGIFQKKLLKHSQICNSLQIPDYVQLPDFRL